MRLPAEFQQPAGNPILAVSAACQQRQRFGHSVVDLSVGQPDFPTPEAVGAAAARAVAKGETRYPPLLGVGALRVALRRSLGAAGLGYSPREILVTAGATGALANAFQALLEPGDRVLVPVPAYPAYADQIRLAGGVVVPVATHAADDYVLRPAALEEAIREAGDVKLLVLNQPNNPTGAVYGADDLRAIGGLAESLDFDLISDEVYGDFVYDGRRHVSPAQLGTELKARTLVVGSLSKSYAMTGWRIGFAAGPAPVIRAMVHVQQANLVGPATPCQWAAVEALNGDQAARRDMVEVFAQRHRYVLERLRAMPGVECSGAGGAFFAFPDLRAYTVDTTGLCRSLLERHGVALVPGAVFGAPSCVRLSYAVAEADLELGLDRLQAALLELEGEHGPAA